MAITNSNNDGTFTKDSSMNERKMPSQRRGSKNVMQSSALYFYLDVVLDVVHGGQRITKFEWPSPFQTMMEHSQKIPQ
jgi:hypothetical protein